MKQTYSIKTALIVLTLALLAAATQTFAQEQKANPIEGEWRVTAQGTPMGTIHFLLALKRDGDKWIGEIRESPMPMKVKAVAVGEDSHVKVEADAAGADLHIAGKLEGEQLAGKWHVGETTDVWAAVRHGSTATAKLPAVRTPEKIPGQFAEDFIAGVVPKLEEIARLEQEVAATPDDFRLVRKLGKGYFFQFFGEGQKGAIEKCRKTFERALELKKDDAETTAYLGALQGLIGQRLEKNDADKQQASYQRSYDLLSKALKTDPRNGAVVSVVSAGYLYLPDSFGTAPIVAKMLEQMRQQIGPMFKHFSHHGQQRILLTQGQAYARMGQTEKARACFEEGWKVNQESVEAALIKAEIDKLKAKS